MKVVILFCNHLKVVILKVYKCFRSWHFYRSFHPILNLFTPVSIFHQPLIILLSIEFFESKQNMQWTFSNCWSWSLFAASLTIAAYADWLGSAASAHALLPMLLQLLTNALSAPEDACAAAALAIKHICDGEYLMKPGLWSIPYQLVKGCASDTTS